MIVLMVIVENPTLVQPRVGQVKMSLEYIKDTLHVMVMHDKDLVCTLCPLVCSYSWCLCKAMV